MINCAFHGHVQRANTCEGAAQSFFRTAKGTLWPLCGACAQRHKELVLKVAQSGGIDAENAAGAVFDISLDDPDTLAGWEAQDPEMIQRVIRAVDQGS
jgi:hypothetical protein